MIVDRLKLKNFRSYVEEEVTFAPGVTLFEGDIGSGKSSLLFAVEFALFGLADVPGEHLLRAGEKEGLIELTFRSGGRSYTVGRRLVRGKTGGPSQKDAYLIADGAREEYSVEQLRAAIIKILGFREQAATKSKSQVFRYGVFTPQEEMKAILEQGAEERRQTLRRAFGIEEYKRARENADLVKQALRERAAGLELVLQGVPRLEEERAAAYRQRDDFAAQLKEAASAREAAMVERKTAEAALRAAELLEASERTLERELGAARVERAKQGERKFAAERALREIAAVEAEVEPLKAAAAEVPRLEAELAAAEAREEERRTLDQELARVDAQFKALEARKAEIAGESEDIRKIVDDSEAIQAGKAALDAARKALEGVREEAAAAREGAERLHALKKRLAALEKEAGEASELGVRLKHLEKEAALGVKAAHELDELGPSINSAQEAQGSARSELERFEREIEDLASVAGKARCPKCRQPLDPAHLDGHRKEVEAAAKESRKRLGHAQAQVRSLEKERASLSKERGEGERAARERETVGGELKRRVQAEHEAGVVSKEIEAAQKAAARADELARKRSTLEREVAAKLPFEKRAAELDAATVRWREVSDQFKKVVKEMEATAKASRATRARRVELGSGHSAEKRLREQVSSARVKAAKLRELERRLATRADLERHRAEAQRDLEGLALRESSIEAQRAALAEKLKEAPVARLRSAFEGAAARSAALAERHNAAGEGLRLQEEALRRATERLEEAAGSRSDLDRVRHTRDFLEQCFQVAFEDVEVKVLADINGQLNRRFQQYFASLMEGAPIDVEIDAEFTPLVQQGANTLPVGALSGGERTSIALAYRLALNILVSRAAGMETPDLLILDEPTDGFSKEQLARVGELLRSLDCQQVVLVSHERELESCADHVFEVVKEGTVSHVAVH